jgi:hypothetical protein
LIAHDSVHLTAKVGVLHRPTGRVVFGFGGENLTVAQSALISAWFKDKESVATHTPNISRSLFVPFIFSFLASLLTIIFNIIIGSHSLRREAAF